jgi:hypothetical protein
LNRKNELRTRVAEEIPVLLASFLKRTFEPPGGIMNDCLWVDVAIEWKHVGPVISTTLWNKPSVKQLLRLSNVNVNSSSTSIDDYFYTYDIGGGSGEPRNSSSSAYVQFYNNDKNAYTTMLGGALDKVGFLECVYNNEYFSTTVQNLNTIFRKSSEVGYQCRNEVRVKSLYLNSLVNRLADAGRLYVERRCFFAIPSDLLSKFKQVQLLLFTRPFSLLAIQEFSLARRLSCRNLLYLSYIMLKNVTRAFKLNLRNNNIRNIFLGENEDATNDLLLPVDVRESLYLSYYIMEYNRPYFDYEQVNFTDFHIHGGVSNEIFELGPRYIFTGCSKDMEDHDPLLKLVNTLDRYIENRGLDLDCASIASTLFQMFAKELILKIPKVHRRLPSDAFELERVEMTFDILPYTNYQIAYSHNINHRSILERFMLYFPFGDLEECVSRPKEWVSWKNLIFFEKWIQIRLIFEVETVEIIAYYLFEYFRKVQYLPCSYRDRLWSQYQNGKYLKVLDVNRLPLVRDGHGTLPQGPSNPQVIPDFCNMDQISVCSSSNEITASFVYTAPPVHVSVRLGNLAKGRGRGRVRGRGNGRARN